MKEVVDRISPRRMNEAIVMLSNIESHKDLLATIKEGLLGRGPHTVWHHTFRYIIGYAITNPGGRVESDLRKIGFLDPELIKGYSFGDGSYH